MLYRIKDYRKHFETKKTVDYHKCKRVTFPNSLNSQQRIQLMKGENGAAFLGVWVSIVQWITGQSWPREGYLTDNTRADGHPLDYDDLSTIILAPAKTIEAALERLSSPKVGWVERITEEVVPADDQNTTIVADQSASPPLPTTPPHSPPLPSEKAILKNDLSSDARADQSGQGDFQSKNLADAERAVITGNIFEAESIRTAEDLTGSKFGDDERSRLIDWIRLDSESIIAREYDNYDCFWYVMRMRFADLNRNGSIKNPAKYFVTGIVSKTDPYMLKPTATEEYGKSYKSIYLKKNPVEDNEFVGNLAEKFKADTAKGEK